MSVLDRRNSITKKFWSNLAALRAARDAEVDALGVAALPPVGSPEFTIDHLDQLLAAWEGGAHEESLLEVWAPLIQVSNRTDLMLRFADEAPGLVLSRLLADSHAMRKLSVEALAAVADRIVRDKLTTHVPQMVDVLLEASVDHPEFFGWVCSSNWRSYGATTVEHHPMRGHYRHGLGHLPETSKVIADWVASHIEDVWPSIHHLPYFVLGFAAAVVPDLEADTAERLAETKCSTEPSSQALHWNLITQCSALSSELKGRLFWGVVSNFGLTQLDFAGNGAALLAHTGLTDPPFDLEKLGSPPHRVFPSSELLDIGRRVLSAPEEHPCFQLLAAARGEAANLSYISDRQVHWLTLSPHLSPEQILRLLHSADRVDLISPTTARGASKEGVSSEVLLPYMSHMTALHVDPSPEISPAVLRRAVEVWAGTYGSEAHFLRRHLEASRPEDVYELLLEMDLFALVKLAVAPSSGGLIMPVVDYLFSTISSADLASAYELADHWEGTLWQMMCVLGVPAPDLSRPLPLPAASKSGS